MSTPANNPTARLSTGLRSWMRDGRGSVSVEFVIAAVLIVTTAVGGMDLHRVVDAQSVTLRAASTMAGYLSLEPVLDATFIEDLARFSYRNEIALPSEAAFVVSAVSRSGATAEEPDPPAVVHWSRTFAVGEDPDSPPDDLGESCSRLSGEPGDGGPAMLEALGMVPGEMVVIVEVCVKLLPQAFVGGGLLADSVFPTRYYQHRVVPVRDETMLEEPS